LNMNSQANIATIQGRHADIQFFHRFRPQRPQWDGNRFLEKKALVYQWGNTFQTKKMLPPSRGWQPCGTAHVHDPGFGHIPTGHQWPSGRLTFFFNVTTQMSVF
jgi:hypothetical protein